MNFLFQNRGITATTGWRGRRGRSCTRSCPPPRQGRRALSASAIPWFNILALAGMLAFVASYRFPKNIPEAAPRAEEMVALARPQAAGAADFIRRNKRFLAFLAGVSLVYLSNAAPQTYFLQIITPKGGDSQSLGITAAIGAALEVPTMVGFARLNRRVRCGTLIQVSLLFFTLKSIGLLLAPNMAGVYLVQCLNISASRCSSPRRIHWRGSWTDRVKTGLPRQRDRAKQHLRQPKRNSDARARCCGASSRCRDRKPSSSRSCGRCGRRTNGMKSFGIGAGGGQGRSCSRARMRVPLFSVLRGIREATDRTSEKSIWRPCKRGSSRLPVGHCSRLGASIHAARGFRPVSIHDFAEAGAVNRFAFLGIRFPEYVLNKSAPFSQLGRPSVVATAQSAWLCARGVSRLAAAVVELEMRARADLQVFSFRPWSPSAEHQRADCSHRSPDRASRAQIQVQLAVEIWTCISPPRACRSPRIRRRLSIQLDQP